MLVTRRRGLTTKQEAGLALIAFMMAGAAITITRTPEVNSIPLCTSNSPTTLLTANLIGYWPLDDNCGGTTPSTAVDLTGNGNTATLHNSPTWSFGTTCEFGGCLKFASASSQYLSTTTTGFPSGTNPTLTDCVWLSLPFAPSATVVLIQYGTFGSHTAFEMFLNSGSLTMAAGIVGFGQVNGVAATAGVFGFYCIEISGQALTFYQNGVNKGTTSADASLNLVFGGNTLGSTVNPSLFTDETGDDWRLYNVALTGAQVLQLYNYGLTYHN